MVGFKNRLSQWGASRSFYSGILKQKTSVLKTGIGAGGRVQRWSLWRTHCNAMLKCAFRLAAQVGLL